MRNNTKAGFALTEVLIALALLVIGVTGQVILERENLKAARQTLVMNAAIRLTAELADWLRASAQPLKNAGVVDVLALFEEQASNLSCYEADCKPMQFAAFELSAWRTRASLLVPRMRLVVCRDGSSGLHWQCSGTEQVLAPVVIKIGWPVNANSQNFAPQLILNVGPIKP